MNYTLQLISKQNVKPTFSVQIFLFQFQHFVQRNIHTAQTLAEFAAKKNQTEMLFKTNFAGKSKLEHAKLLMSTKSLDVATTKVLKKIVSTYTYLHMCKQGRRNELFQASPPKKFISKWVYSKENSRDSFLPIELQLEGYCRLFLIWK